MKKIITVKIPARIAFFLSIQGVRNQERRKRFKATGIKETFFDAVTKQLSSDDYNQLWEEWKLTRSENEVQVRNEVILNPGRMSEQARPKD